MQNKISINKADLEGILSEAQKESGDGRQTTSNPSQYTLSNERYSISAIDFLSHLEGIENYLGIAGGGSQQFLLFSSLGQNNKLRKATLIDFQALQLKNFAELAAAYNIAKTPGEFREYLKKRNGGAGYEFESRRVENLKEDTLVPELRYPRLTTPLDVSLKRADVRDYINGKMQKGRYFIYLSNATVSPWMKDEESKSVLKGILNNPDFEDGSRVMLVAESAYKIAVLKKEGGKFKLEYSDK